MDNFSCNLVIRINQLVYATDQTFCRKVTALWYRDLKGVEGKRGIILKMLFSISINKCFQTISIKCTLIVSYDNHFLLRYIYTWKIPAAAKAFLDMVTDKHQIINLPYNTDDKLGGEGGSRSNFKLLSTTSKLLMLVLSSPKLTRMRVQYSIQILSKKREPSFSTGLLQCSGRFLCILLQMLTCLSTWKVAIRFQCL